MAEQPTTAGETPAEQFAGMVIIGGVRYRPEDVPEGAVPDERPDEPPAGKVPAKARTAENKGGGHQGARYGR